ncbi:MAG TPA: aminopeptidase [Caldisericia bacterium]|nr:aminopeptidase [Caldisericia bacterium]HPF48235.1 aminopeptidase [Caldisericia bacterium]HPI83829.1 aminopeptidase [Caldisericia bacterium]HPQ92688.1 aminopeptidase [Caldisericia bacterium]HRV74214.1 aminopeptidase [Caldisericia bacterium]
MANDEKKETLTDRLCQKSKSIWEDEKLHGAIFDFAKPYSKFLTENKTERECTVWAIDELKKAGFVEGVSGNKCFMVNRGKAIIAAIKGKKSIENGFTLVVAHTDSPRIDLKQNPMYEDTGNAMFDTHYYGGIKKWQWTNIPLAIHGTIIKKDGTKLDVKWGEDGDTNFGPVLISDILIHLSSDQMTNPAHKIISGENLNALAGTMPLVGEDYKDEKDKVKLNILKLLNDKYGITEADFISAEFELVPAYKAQDVGMDKSLVMGYGHDDRICSYTALRALCDLKEQPELTAIVYLVDKEEIGSEGTTGAKTQFLEHFVSELAGGKPLWSIMQNSFCMSADVNAAFDVGFKDRFEAKNASYLGKGITLTKFTGRGGKGGSNDASAEFVGAVRMVLEDECVPFQTAELGAVDIGGGGTVAMYIAERGIDTIDAGPAVLGMHAPNETISKADLYGTYLAFVAFLGKFGDKYIKVAKGTH